MLVVSIIVICFYTLLLLKEVVSIVKRKRLIKEIKSNKGDHFNINFYETEIDGEKHFLAYSILKPETYKKVKATEYTTSGFDMDTAYLEFCKISLFDEKIEVVSNLIVECVALRGKIDKKTLELVRQVKECDISEKNLLILKEGLVEKAKKNELFKDYL